MIRTAALTTTPPAKGTPRSRPALLPMVVLALVVIAVVATGVGYFETSGGATSYACMGVSHQGSNVQVTTTGLLHYVKAQYYISCNEGSNLPSNDFKSSCLTISPLQVLAPIGVGAATYYYYLSSGGHTITLQGAPAPTNGTEIITPASISLSISC
jgi:hypothetical protein